MTIHEYTLRFLAFRLSNLDKRQAIYEQAWANAQVKSERKVGSKTVPKFDTFDKFFDYKKQENEILGISEGTKSDPKLLNLLRKANS